MMRFILAVTLVVWPLRAAAVAPSDIFDVDPSCNTATIQQYINEGGEMIEAINNFYTAAKSGSTGGINRAARGYWKGLMNWDVPPTGSTDEETTTASAVISRASTLLIDGMIPEDATRAYLTCNANIFKQVSLTSDAVQANGNPDVNVLGQKVTVQDRYPRQVRLYGPNAVAYLLDLNGSFQYVFSSGKPPCASYSTLGETFLEGGAIVRGRGQSVIVLCPVFFSKYNMPSTLGGRVPRPQLNKIPILKSQQSLDWALPYSSTFFHEVMHYAPWPEVKTPDNTYKLEGCRTLQPLESLVTPECWTFLGVGSWYTQNKQATVKGRSVDITYASGACYVLQ